MPEDIVILPILFGLFGFVAWITFTTIRRYKTAKLQAGVAQVRNCSRTSKVMRGSN